jgi:hypothetical protein
MEKEKITLTKDQYDKIRVLNLLMWLQSAVYASDECEQVSWFYNHKTKMLLKRLPDVIQKEHGKTIQQLWDVDGALLPEITTQMEEFGQEMANYGYWMLPELTEFIREKRMNQPKITITE